MKLLIISLISILTTLQPTGQNQITVIVENVKDVKGKMSIGLFDSDENFPKVGKAYREVEKRITGDKFIYTFSNIPDGTYGIALFQDLNENGKMDKNFLGIPSEPYGFSNNASKVFGVPDFDDATFSVEGSNLTIKITLK